MGTVVDFNHPTRLDIPAHKILSGAVAANLSDVVVIGYREDGGFYFASSHADAAEANWLLDYAKSELMAIVKRIEDESA